MNSRGRINCLAKVVWRVVHSRLQRGLPPRSRQSGASGGRGAVLYPWSPLFIALRALVPSGLACVLARPPYGEAQPALWAARWAKSPDEAAGSYQLSAAEGVRHG
jgi:hypothetical protein